MVKKYISLVILLIMVLAGSGNVLAQDDTTTTASSTVSIFAVICNTQAVVNFNGVMLSNQDIYFQVFSGSQGTGTALSTLRRANVTGTYTFSEIITYPEGQTVAAGGVGSVYVSISRAGSPENSAYSEYVDDLQDGCGDPQYALGASVAEGGNAIPGSPDVTTGSPGTNSAGTSTILSPFGGFLNPNYTPPPQDDVVVIGARRIFTEPRHETAGLIFAECNDYPVAVPGLVYDTDDVVVFWSWFAETAEQVQDHINNANYSVTYYQTLPLPNVQVSAIQQIGSFYWVFYTARLGNLLPGQYYIQYQVSWDNAITDGISDYGPGTDTEALYSGCGFRILPNIAGDSIGHTPWPFQ
ncbi:MAG: hypothetical protein RLP44_28580 [Aggregatilineales bacterium]